MKINYPIKYALMPIVEQTGWFTSLHEMEREYDVVCYIVSKCYLISDLKKYNEDGSVTQEHEVVFPYQHSEFNRWKRVIPFFNLMHGYCTNSHKVDFVFDTYEEALDYASIKNKELCTKTWIYLPYSKIEEKKEEFNIRLEKYKILEHQILLKLEDIEIDSKAIEGPVLIKY